jgi:hypothetical protein
MSQHGSPQLYVGGYGFVLSSRRRPASRTPTGRWCRDTTCRVIFVGADGIRPSDDSQSPAYSPLRSPVPSPRPFLLPSAYLCVIPTGGPKARSGGIYFSDLYGLGSVPSLVIPAKAGIPFVLLAPKIPKKSRSNQQGNWILHSLVHQYRHGSILLCGLCNDQQTRKVIRI